MYTVKPLLWFVLAVLALLAGCGAKDNSSAAPILQPVTVSGVVRYEDWEYGVNGYTGNVGWKAVRHAIIDLVDDTGQILDSTESSANGEYSVSGAGTGLYIRVLAQTATDAPLQVSINNYTGSIYSATASVAAGEGNTTLNLDIRDGDITGGAFNMLDVFTTAAQFIQTYSNTVLPPLAIYWQRGDSQYGTYYCFNSMTLSQCPQGGGIYVGGGFGNSGGDIDHYDDDVLWHEFSHFLEDVLQIDDSPGGPHQMTQNTLDLRLAWSEGWGDYFSIAVKAWLAGTAPELLSATAGTANSVYIDTVGNLANSDVNIAIDIDNPGLCGVEDCYTYASNEIAVAKVLDRLRQMYGMQAIWDVYQGYLNSLNNGVVNLESFWDGFLTQTQPDGGQLAIVESIYNERQIYYREDVYESAGDAMPNALRQLNPCTMLQCGQEVHFFYRADGADDVDVVAFSAQAGKTYLIETFDLKNGADTYIYLITVGGETVLDTNGNPIENDDRNDDCGQCINDALSFSSQLQFTAPSTDTYYIKIVTSADATDGAGRYGTYSLKVTEYNL